MKGDRSATCITEVKAGTDHVQGNQQLLMLLSVKGRSADLPLHLLTPGVLKVLTLYPDAGDLQRLFESLLAEALWR